ncbi:MAG: hypothetical protein L0Y67_05960 [Gammaproteobacteria bacterium]|nr:hypothetical protein [Gammaproteobacteria bacterium]
MNPNVERFLVSALHRLEPDGRPIPHNRWQRVLSKALRMLMRAPYRSPWMEWEYGTWVGTFAGHDEVGRQLGEANVLPEWMTTPLKDNWRPFMGPGVRHGHPFNVDAMLEMVHCWDDLLLDAATLRDMYCRRHHREGKTLSAKDLYILTTIAVSIPSFLLRRGDAPTGNGALPRRAAAAFKVIGGMYAATNRMLSQGHPMLTQAELNIDEFLQYIEAERLLLSPESRACAAPVKMIRQILSTVIDPCSDKPAHDGLSHLGADAERAFAYGALCARIDLGVLLYWRSLRHYLRPLLRQPDTSPAVRDALLREPELGIEDNTPLRAYGEVAQHLLALFESTAPEQELMAALPFSEQEEQDIGSETIGVNCYRLEMAMRTFARRQQSSLDQLLQRQSPKLPEDAWSPAPGSSFLKDLLKADSRLAVSL